MRGHKNINLFRTITASKSAALLILFVNKSLYGLCPARQQAARLQVKPISTPSL
ncbi:hypothetical protein PSAT104721_07670 [Pseudoalteromonas atlantica]